MHRLILMMLTVGLVLMAGTAGAKELKVDLDIGVGYRTDKLDWSISLGEDEWKDLDIVYSKASVRISYKKFHAKGLLGYGRIIDGSLRESSFSDISHQSEISRVTADTDGYVFDASFGIGPKLASGNVSIIPLIGYSWHLQYIQTNGGLLDGTTPIPDFTLTDEFRWQGPWVGLDFILQPDDKARLFASVEYHFGDYRAQDLLTSAGMGYDQRADAQGLVLAAGLSLNVNDSWDIGLESQYIQWKSDVGVHGYAHTGFDTLNEANWESLIFMFNATYRFYQLNGYNKLSRL